MNSFSFIRSGSDLLDEFSGWIVATPCVSRALCYGLYRDYTGAHALFTGMMDQCQAEKDIVLLSLFPGFSLEFLQLDSRGMRGRS